MVHKTYHMVKIFYSARLSHTFDLLNITVRVCRKKFTSTTILITAQKCINPVEKSKEVKL